MLSVMPRSPLHDMGVMIATRAREKAAFLTERLRMPSYSSRMDKPMLMETQMIVQGLVSALPPLEAFLYSNTGHPYTFYLLLCGMAGSVAGYAGATLPPVFPAYNQNDLLATFAPVRDFINKILDSIHESYVAIAFQLEAGRFTLLPREEWLDRHFVIGVRAKQGTTEQDLIDWINDCVIGSSKHTQDMRDKRILGAARQRIDKDTELDLIPTRGIVLFRVTVDERFISKDDLLEIANTSNIDARHRPSEVIFYARNLLPAESGKS
jgi:type VI secretion system protein ImpJ